VSSVDVYKAKWRDDILNELNYFESYEAQFPVFATWERLEVPEQLAMDLLRNAFDLLYASASPELSHKFLNWTIEVVDRSLRDGKLAKSTSHSNFPENRGQALRSRAYASALLTGELGLADAKQALEDLMENIQQLEILVREENHHWEDMEEANLLAPSRLALILHDLDRFDELLPYHREFKWHKVEAELLVEVAEATRQGHALSNSLVDRFVHYFDEVRAPTMIQVESEKREHGGTIYSDMDLRRFEIGVIYAKYIDTSEPFTWRRAIELIAR